LRRPERHAQTAPSTATPSCEPLWRAAADRRRWVAAESSRGRACGEKNKKNHTRIEHRGLTLVEAKQLLTTIPQRLLQQQVDAFLTSRSTTRLISLHIRQADVSIVSLLALCVCPLDEVGTIGDAMGKGHGRNPGAEAAGVCG
jgi:hypothetical protein